MTEKGPLNKIIQNYVPNPQICPSNEGKALGFENLISAFLVIISGIVSGLIILMLELIAKKMYIDPIQN